MRERQAAQVAAAFILRAGRAVGGMKLTKLIYLAEREVMKRHVFPIVFDDIYAMQQGMALSRTYDLTAQKPHTPTNGEWEKYIAPRSYQGINVRRGISTNSLDCLSRNHIECIDHVWDTFGSMNRDELIHEVHHNLDEWDAYWNDQFRRSSAIKVPYVELLQRLCSIDQSNAVRAAEEIAYYRSLGMDETDHLLDSTANAEQLRQSIAQHRSGELLSATI